MYAIRDKITGKFSSYKGEGTKDEAFGQPVNKINLQRKALTNCWVGVPAVFGDLKKAEKVFNNMNIVVETYYREVENPFKNAEIVNIEWNVK